MLDRLRDMIAVIEVTLPKPIELASLRIIQRRAAGRRQVGREADHEGRPASRPLDRQDRTPSPSPSWCRAGDHAARQHDAHQAGRQDSRTQPRAGALDFKITVPPPAAPEKKDSGVGVGRCRARRLQDKKAAAKKEEAKEVKEEKKETEPEEKKQRVDDAVVEEVELSRCEPQEVGQQEGGGGGAAGHHGGAEGGHSPARRRTRTASRSASERSRRRRRPGEGEEAEGGRGREDGKDGEQGRDRRQRRRSRRRSATCRWTTSRG